MKHVNFVIFLKYRSLCGGSAVIALAVIGLGRLGGLWGLFWSFWAILGVLAADCVLALTLRRFVFSCLETMVSSDVITDDLHIKVDLASLPPT